MVLTYRVESELVLVRVSVSEPRVAEASVVCKASVSGEACGVSNKCV